MSGGESPKSSDGTSPNTASFKVKYPKANKKCKKACLAAGFACKEIEGASPNKRGKIPACCQDNDGTCQVPSAVDSQLPAGGDSSNRATFREKYRKANRKCKKSCSAAGFKCLDIPDAMPDTKGRVPACCQGDDGNCQKPGPGTPDSPGQPSSPTEQGSFRAKYPKANRKCKKACSSAGFECKEIEGASPNKRGFIPACCQDSGECQVPSAGSLPNESSPSGTLSFRSKYKKANRKCKKSCSAAGFECKEIEDAMPNKKGFIPACCQNIEGTCQEPSSDSGGSTSAPTATSPHSFRAKYKKANRKCKKSCSAAGFECKEIDGASPNKRGFLPACCQNDNGDCQEPKAENLGGHSAPKETSPGSNTQFRTKYKKANRKCKKACSAAGFACKEIEDAMPNKKGFIPACCQNSEGACQESSAANSPTTDSSKPKRSSSFLVKYKKANRKCKTACSAAGFQCKEVDGASPNKKGFIPACCQSDDGECQKPSESDTDDQSSAPDQTSKPSQSSFRAKYPKANRKCKKLCSAAGFDCKEIDGASPNKRGFIPACCQGDDGVCQKPGLSGSSNGPSQPTSPAEQSTGASFRPKYRKTNRKCKKACAASGFECNEIADAMPNKQGFIPACCQDSDGTCQNPSDSSGQSPATSSKPSDSSQKSSTLESSSFRSKYPKANRKCKKACSAASFECKEIEGATPNRRGFIPACCQDNDGSCQKPVGGETQKSNSDQTSTQSQSTFRLKYPKANRKCKKACSSAGFECKEIDGASPDKKGRIPACCQSGDGTCQKPNEGGTTDSPTDGSTPAGSASFRSKYPKANRKCKKACSAAGFECEEIKEAMPNKRGFIPACCQNNEGACQESSAAKSPPSGTSPPKSPSNSASFRAKYPKAGGRCKRACSAAGFECKEIDGASPNERGFIPACCQGNDETCQEPSSTDPTNSSKAPSTTSPVATFRIKYRKVNRKCKSACSAAGFTCSEMDGASPNKRGFIPACCQSDDGTCQKPGAGESDSLDQPSLPADQSAKESFRAKYPKANQKCKKACSAAGFKCKEIDGASPNKRGFIPACCQNDDGSCQTSSGAGTTESPTDSSKPSKSASFRPKYPKAGGKCKRACSAAGFECKEIDGATPNKRGFISACCQDSSNVCKLPNGSSSSGAESTGSKSSDPRQTSVPSQSTFRVKYPKVNRKCKKACSSAGFECKEIDGASPNKRGFIPACCQSDDDTCQKPGAGKPGDSGERVKVSNPAQQQTGESFRQKYPKANRKCKKACSAAGFECKEVEDATPNKRGFIPACCQDGDGACQEPGSGTDQPSTPSKPEKTNTETLASSTTTKAVFRAKYPKTNRKCKSACSAAGYKCREIDGASPNRKGFIPACCQDASKECQNPNGSLSSSSSSTKPKKPTTDSAASGTSFFRAKYPKAGSKCKKACSAAGFQCNDIKGASRNKRGFIPACCQDESKKCQSPDGPPQKGSSSTTEKSSTSNSATAGDLNKFF